MTTNPETLCRTCVTVIGWIDSPTGGWWAHETHPADGHDAAPGAWVDGDELMEAIAAEVWEHCAGEGTSLVVDDPRNIAGTAAAVARRMQAAVLPPPADRAAVLREVADWLKAWRPEFFERWAVVEQDRYEGGVDDAAAELRRMADEAQQPAVGARQPDTETPEETGVALARYIADRPVSEIQAAIRILGWPPLRFELVDDPTDDDHSCAESGCTGEPTAAASAVPGRSAATSTDEETQADPNTGPGWYEVINPRNATTSIALVHEDGTLYLPEGDDLTADEFAFAAARGNAHRLIRADDAEARP